MHNAESVLENERHKLLRDFVIKKDHLILTRTCNNQQKKKRKELAELWTLLSWLTTE